MGNRSPNSSTLKELNQIHRRTNATPSELSSFCPFTQRSPAASANAGLNATTALRLERGSVSRSMLLTRPRPRKIRTLQNWRSRCGPQTRAPLTI